MVISLLHSGGFGSSIREKCPAPELIHPDRLSPALDVNENCIRPSGPCLPSCKCAPVPPSPRFSGDSRFTPLRPPWRDREAVDDKVSISCFGSLRNLSSSHQDSSDSHSRQEHKAVGQGASGCHGRCVQRRVRCPQVELQRGGHTEQKLSTWGSLAPCLVHLITITRLHALDQSDSVDSSPVKGEVPKPPRLPRKETREHNQEIPQRQRHF